MDIKALNKSNFFTWSLTLILLLEFLLLAFLLEKQSSKQSFLSLIIQVYGGFMATLFGVYISLLASKQEGNQKEERALHKTMLGSLKIIWSELDLNERALNHLIENGLEKIQRELFSMHDSLDFLINSTGEFKSKAFYGCITSGAINDISQNGKIFNGLQQAYYNLELSYTSLIGLRSYYEEYKDKNYLTDYPDQRTAAIKQIDLLIEKLKKTLKMVIYAKKEVYIYLEGRGVIFTEDEIHAH